MMEMSALEQRLTELEMRMAFQEQALMEMSDALAASRMEATRNAELLRRALDDMKQSRGEFFADPDNEPPPPHY
ncbi:SlyX family protein [Cognatiluteimonas profundi]|uniref:SlyX family protein n=1 Tax=Cognatiluteimonas profundi TaxID=2594501 RepID=UPI00131A9A56|nr:SlyX family protein [Lysobacter profundi]